MDRLHGGAAFSAMAAAAPEQDLPCMVPHQRVIEQRRSARRLPNDDLRDDSAQFAVRRFDAMHELLRRQEADGAFGWHEELEKPTLGGRTWNYRKAWDEVRALTAGMEGTLQKRVVATGVVLVALRTNFAMREGEWRVAGQKALRWLEKVAPEVRRWVETG